jgi:SAM-dependent methyltransferase
LAEFTGERLIPGQVDINLLNEHVARYTFAARLARGKRVLDTGCGAGYGSAELAHNAASAVGADIAAEAVDYANANYQLPNLSFEQASCTALPHPDSVFDLVVAFEVIEHLEDYRALLLEARRVLSPNGQFIVSTPNKLYYTESRGREGANPFHVHEFQFEEFRSELKQVFPYVELFLENHTEGVTFHPHEHGRTVETRVDSGDVVPDESHFFLAICAPRKGIESPTFIYVPRTGNVLRERGRHIRALEGELELKNDWLVEFDRRHQKLLEMFREQKEQLEQSNHWAETLRRELGEAHNRIVELQEELAREQENARQTVAAYEDKIRKLEADHAVMIGWVRDTERRLEAEIEEKKSAIEALHDTERELEERTAWAVRLEAERRGFEEQVTLYQGSRWVKFGRRVGLGPEVPTR